MTDPEDESGEQIFLWINHQRLPFMAHPHRFVEHSVTPDELDAGSRRYGPDVIVLLPLKSGRIAILNCCREICGYMDNDFDDNGWFLKTAQSLWRPARAHRKPPKTVTLKELGL
jgi:hypothetical protein